MSSRTPSAPSQFRDGAADVARRFGITIKALRLYEEAGLIRPVRDGHGWRTYGQAECERLHLILTLRRFGFTLARIGTMLAEGAPDLAAALALQERALRDQRTHIDEALALIDRARERLDAGEAIDPAALAALARTQPLRWHWTPALAQFAARFLSVEQSRTLSRTAPALHARWGAVFADLDRLAGGAPDTPEARALGRTAAALIAEMTGGDADLGAAVSAFWRAGFADPELAPTLPMDEAKWCFLGAAMAAAARDRT